MTGIFLDEHLPDRAPRLPPVLARAEAAQRAVALDNPGWGSDALLIQADAWNEAAIAFETHLLTGHAEGARRLSALCRDQAARARALAPVFAPPTPDAAPAPSASPPSSTDAP